MGLLGETGLGYGLQAREDFTIEKMAEAQQARADKLAAAKNKDSNASLQKLISDNMSLSKENFHPAIAGETADRIKSDFANMITNQRTNPNNYQMQNAMTLNNLNDYLTQQRALSKNLEDYSKEALQSPDAEVQKSGELINSAQNRKDLDKILPQGKYSNFQKGANGTFSLSSVGKIADEDKPEKYVNLDHNNLPDDIVSKYVGAAPLFNNC